MNGLLQEQSEIEKLQKEYKALAENHFNRTPATESPLKKEEGVTLENCES